MKRIFIIGIVIIVLGCLGYLGYLYIRNKKSSREPFQSSETPESPPTPYMCMIIKAAREKCVGILKKAEDEGKSEAIISKAKLSIKIVDEELSKMKCS